MLIAMLWHTSGILLRVGPSSAIAVSGHVQVPTILCIVSRIVLLWVIRHHMELKISNSFQIRLISLSTLITANSRATWTSGHVSRLKWVSSSLTVKIRTLLTDLSNQYTLDSKVQIWTTKLIASWITLGWFLHRVDTSHTFPNSRISSTRSYLRYCVHWNASQKDEVHTDFARSNCRNGRKNCIPKCWVKISP